MSHNKKHLTVINKYKIAVALSMECSCFFSSHQKYQESGLVEFGGLTGFVV